MKTIEELKKEEVEARKNVYKAQELREKELLPKYRKEYVGKCFKIRNSFGGDRPKWWLYLKILDVDSVNFHNGEEPVFKIIQMESPSDNSVTTRIHEYHYVREEYIPISKKEFDKAKESLINKLKDYLKD